MANECDTAVQCLFQRKSQSTLQSSILNLRTTSEIRSDHDTKVYSRPKNRPCNNYDSIKEKSTVMCAGKNSILIYVHKKNRKLTKNLKKINVFEYSKNEIIFLINTKKNSRHYSMLNLKKHKLKQHDLQQSKSSDLLRKSIYQPYKRTYFVNNCRTCDKTECNNPFMNPSLLAKIYKCQKNENDNCCCSCNSEALFEVMKGLYDCYKKKNCENCTCILCGACKLAKEISVGEEGLAGMAVPPDRMKKAQAQGLLTPLEGKTADEQEKILKGLAKLGLPLPEGKTPSQKKLIEKVRNKMGLPPEPKNSGEQKNIQKAYAEGIITPLEAKTRKKKEAALKKMAAYGLPLPEGRTPSEKELIDKIEKGKKLSGVSSEKLKKAKAEGFVTPLEGKTLKQKEKILKGLANYGITLPEGKTASEKKLIDKIKKDMGLPPEPKTSLDKKKLQKAYSDGIITPLEGKTTKQKELAIRRMAAAGIPLPEGRSPSEKSLIDKIQKEKRLSRRASDRLKEAKAAGLITPLEGKTLDEKEKILRGLATHGIPLPEGKTASEKKLIVKVKKDMGLPPEPKTSLDKKKLQKAYSDGIITPLEGKTLKQKESAIRKMAAAGITLPEGRTASEKKLIYNIGKEKRPSESIGEKIVIRVPSERLKKAKTEGFITPLEGKTREQKEKILKGLAKHGIPLPEGKTASEKKLIDKIKKDMGLPPEPKTPLDKEKLQKAYSDGIITPLEGKTTKQKESAIRRMAAAGIPLPEGRSPSEKNLIDKIQKEKRLPGRASDRLKEAKSAGIITPLEGKTPDEKEKILRGLATHGIPLPEGKTASEKKLIDKIKKDMGLPPEPKTSLDNKKLQKAYSDGIITPLEGKTPKQKESAIRKMAAAGIRLPEGRTASEKKLIDKIEKEKRPSESIGEKRVIRVPSKRLKKAKAEGFITPLEGKTPEQKEKILKGLAKHGIPLPEGKTASEKKLIDKVKKDMGLPPEPKTSLDKKKLQNAYSDGIITPLEGMTPKQKESAIKRMAAAGIPLPEGRSPSEKSLIDKIEKQKRPSGRASDQLKEVKAAGLITTLEEKTPEDIITPLAGKSPKQKEVALKKIFEAGIPLPEGRTPSEKQLIYKIKKERKPLYKPSEKLQKAIADEILTNLGGKSPEEKEKILKSFAKSGIPMPEGKTPSEKRLIDKVKKDMGLPPEPKSSAEKKKMRDLYSKGIITPLEGKSPSQKELALRKMADAEVSLPERRSPSELAIINKVKADIQRRKFDKMKEAAAKGLFTPLKGKTPEKKEEILKELGDLGLPLPEGKTSSEKKLIDKVRKDLGLPPEPKTPSEKVRMSKAYAKGLITPLDGKTFDEKVRILKQLADNGISLPVAKTATEKLIIKKIEAEQAKRQSQSDIRKKPEKLKKTYADSIIMPLEGKTPEEKKAANKKMVDASIILPKGRSPSEQKIIDKVVTDKERKQPLDVPSEKIKKAIAEGFITPLKGKSPEKKEIILKGLVKLGIPLPEGKTLSEKEIIDKVRKDMGLPPEPKTSAERKKLKQAYIKGVVTPLEGKTLGQKQAAIQKMFDAGITLPEGRTNSEINIIDQFKRGVCCPCITSDNIEKVRLEMEPRQTPGILTPLKGKTPEQKYEILSKMAVAGLPLPEGTTPSDKKVIEKIKADKAAGILTPLEGKTLEEKEKILNKMQAAGIPLPAAKTASEKVLMSKIKARKLSALETKNKIEDQGMNESVKEIIKSSKCDRACGCDRKKIRFKHSYIKIRVTSPDISSLCDCPHERFPGVKNGVFIDDEGIKVTVGYSQISSFKPSRFSLKSQPSTLSLHSNPNFTSFCTAALGSENWNDVTNINTVVSNKFDKASNRLLYDKKNRQNIFYAKTYEPSDAYSHSEISKYENKSNTNYSIAYWISTNTSENTALTQNQPSECSSYNSLILVKTESYLNLSERSQPTELGTISVISFEGSTFSEISDDFVDSVSITDYLNGNNSCRVLESEMSDDDDFYENSNNNLEDIEKSFLNNNDFIILRISKSKNKNVNNSESDPENIVNIVAKEILKQNSQLDSSSIYVVVPSTEEYTNSDASLSSNRGKTSKKYYSKMKLDDNYPIVASSHQILIASRGVKLTAIPKQSREKEDENKKKSKTNKKKRKIRINLDDDSDIENVEREIYHKKVKCPQIRDKGDNTIDSAESKNKNSFEPDKILCRYHQNKLKNTIKKSKNASLNSKSSQVAMNYDVSSNDKMKKKGGILYCTKKKMSNFLKYSDHKIVGTTESLNKTVNKSIEIKPKHLPKSINTTIDGLNSSSCTISITSSNIKSAFRDKHLTAEAFVRNSIPYLIQAQNFVSHYATPSDSAPCKCPAKKKSLALIHPQAQQTLNKPADTNKDSTQVDSCGSDCKCVILKQGHITNNPQVEKNRNIQYSENVKYIPSEYLLYENSSGNLSMKNENQYQNHEDYVKKNQKQKQMIQDLVQNTENLKQRLQEFQKSFKYQIVSEHEIPKKPKTVTQLHQDYKENIQNQPQMYQNNKEHFQNQPQMYQNNKENFQNQSQMYQNNKENFTNQLQMNQNNKENFQDQPQMYQNNKENFQNQPQMYQNNKENFQNQPQMYQNKKENLQNQPQTYRNNKENLQNQPPIYQNNKENFQNQPQMYQNNKENFQNLSKMYQNNKENFQNQPQMYQNNKENFQNQPQMYQNNKKNFQNQPQMYQSYKENFQNQPQICQKYKENMRKLNQSYQELKVSLNKNQTYQIENEKTQKKNITNQNLIQNFKYQNQPRQVSLKNITAPKPDLTLLHQGVEENLQNQYQIYQDFIENIPNQNQSDQDQITNTHIKTQLQQGIEKNSYQDFMENVPNENLLYQNQLLNQLYPDSIENNSTQYQPSQHFFDNISYQNQPYPMIMDDVPNQNQWYTNTPYDFENDNFQNRYYMATRLENPLVNHTMKHEDHIKKIAQANHSSRCSDCAYRYKDEEYKSKFNDHKLASFLKEIQTGQHLTRHNETSDILSRVLPQDFLSRDFLAMQHHTSHHKSAGNPKSPTSTDVKKPTSTPALGGSKTAAKVNRYNCPETYECPKNLCNICCSRGRYIEAHFPGNECDPCERYGQVFGRGIKLSNSKHSKYHLNDLMICENPSDTCCCDKKENKEQSVDKILDALKRLMEAQYTGKIIQSDMDDNFNIRDPTRKILNCNYKENLLRERNYSLDECECKCPESSYLQLVVSEDNCVCPDPPQSEDKGSSGNWKQMPYINIRHLGLRKLSEEAKKKPKEVICECRATKNGAPPLEECYCPPQENCKCPPPTDEEWVEYLGCMTSKDQQRNLMKLQTEMTQTTSGFKVLKKRKDCVEELTTYEQALEFYGGGQVKPDPDGRCLPCGDLNCPGQWNIKELNDYNNPEFGDQPQIQRHAKEHSKESCIYGRCDDGECPGMGPYGLLPPIPGGAVADVKIIGKEERGQHRACVCEPRSKFEDEIYCPREGGPTECECAAVQSSNVSCECWPEGIPPQVEVKRSKSESKKSDSSDSETKKNWNDPCGPLGGFKFSVSAKGPNNDAAKGFCCFNAIESSVKNSNVSSSESSTYVMYV